MALKINGVSGSFPVPRIISDKYSFTKFDGKMTATMADGKAKNVEVGHYLQTVWESVVKRSKAKACNDYFMTLYRHKSLSEVLTEGDIVIHCLQPKRGYSYDDIPDANTAGRDIGIDPSLLFDPEGGIALVCALIHELAHVAGASTNPRDPVELAHAAEKALPSCQCEKQYRKNVLGQIERIDGSGGGGQRLA